MIKKLSFSINSLLKVTKKYSTSKLYIPYNQTSDTYVVVEPYVDMEDHLKNRDILKKNINLRGLNIDVDKICDNWPNFLNVRNKLVDLNNERNNFTEQIKKSKNDVKDMNRLKENRSKVIDQLKLLKKQISSLEKEVVIPSLSIPNSIHSECPLSETKVLSRSDGKTKHNNTNWLGHVEIGTTLDCLDYINPVIFYLKNEASLCEQAIMSYFSESLERLDFVPFCNSDFVKSVIVEGCGIDINNPDLTLILNDKNLHLVGGASVQSFCALLTKQSVGENKLPLKLCTAGRSYKPSDNDIGLFSATQTNAVQLLIGSANTCKSKAQFDETLIMYKQLYDDIGLDYRIVYTPVSAMENWESLKARVELYSIGRKSYVEVASLSLSGDFISKRLRIYWSNKNKRDFLHIINGKIVDTNVLLGCLLEQNVQEFTIPNCFKSHMIV